jgi:hypothetical protein
MLPNPYLSDLVNREAKIVKRVRRVRALVGVVALSGILAGEPDAWASGPSDGHGLAVVAEGSSTSSAWQLARAIYGDPSLRPPELDEGQARALAGEAVAPDALREIRDLAETRAALHGDDAPSRSLLSGLVAALHVKGLVVVEVPDGAKPTARVFVMNAHAFDTVVYESDPSAVVTWGSEAPVTHWTGALTALHRAFGDPVAVSSASRTAPPAAVALQNPSPPIEGEKSGTPGKPFYTSPWFWGAIAVAAFAGAAFYFVSRGSSDPTISLEVQVPK